MVFLNENKWVLAVMNHKVFLGVVATLVRTNIGQRIASPRGTQEVISCPQEMNRGPDNLRSSSKQCKLSSFGQPESAIQERKPKLSISDLIHATECSFGSGHRYSSFPIPKSWMLQVTHWLVRSFTLRNSGLISQELIVHPGIAGRWG